MERSTPSRKVTFDPSVPRWKSLQGDPPMVMKTGSPLLTDPQVTQTGRTMMSQWISEHAIQTFYQILPFYWHDHFSQLFSNKRFVRFDRDIRRFVDV